MHHPPRDVDEDHLLRISALQHYLFCPRQCALIHIERVWMEDAATAEGQLLHQRVDAGGADRRAGVRTARGLVLRSLTHGLAGKADAVEFGSGGAPYPVEYKRGRPKAHQADAVQLCAQALCLEEMFGKQVTEGALFYAQTRRRLIVAIDDDLRTLTVRVIADARAMLIGGVTPPPVPTPACRRCSIAAVCQPGPLAKPPAVQRWLDRQLAAVGMEM